MKKLLTALLALTLSQFAIADGHPSITIPEESFSINKLWDLLIARNNLQGEISNSKIAHIGDINAFNQFKDN